MDVENCFKINLYLYNETWRMNSLILFQRFSANKKGTPSTNRKRKIIFYRFYLGTL